ncbi:symmetrical bis(5'-nucleosyl)-tetraphosphatase [Halioxenophilus sp. WMMB6]|uniref:symmetrical bis(5'-nucleosyl)-tetraphosphatase n=1 Tax=Halioxenophilus sp. WMMB6 TaxID=3073815 RepID=UPI00295EE3D2|nr:symmetrical bis(5'-nucleosyl)-tetraphosphatase [Halioxenophilus sp. WMMB6]
MPTYAVGDLQGCLDPLLCLLQEVKFDPTRDRLWLVGDLVNRGPKSAETLAYLYDLRDCVVCVLGNHDLHLLAYAFGHRKASRSDTLHTILEHPEHHQWLAWLRQMPLVHWDESLGYALVHAGIPPQWSIAAALARSAEVEEVLRDDSQFENFLANMYGNKPLIWSDELQGFERLRVITNYFTRMRFCKADGELELTSKEEPGHAPVGYQPWFQHYLAKPDNPPVIFGHWAALNGETHSHKAIGLDTGCVWGNRLTLLCLEDGRRWQCRCPS